MPTESFFVAVQRPSSAAMHLTSVLRTLLKGNSTFKKAFLSTFNKVALVFHVILRGIQIRRPIRLKKYQHLDILVKMLNNCFIVVRQNVDQQNLAMLSYHG